MGMPDIFPNVIPKEKEPLEYPDGMGEDYEEEYEDEYEERASVFRPFLFF